MNLTVVIPTRNRADQVQALIKELNGLDCEIIVVADQQDRVAVKGARVVEVPPKLGSGESRNTGCRQAKGAWILLLDDDLIPSPGLAGFINNLLPRLKPRDVVGFRIVGSNNIGDNTIRYRNTGIFRMMNILFGVDISPRSGPSRFLQTAMMFPSQFFLSLGGFDSRTYTGNGFREESDLQWRARKMGGRLTYIEDPFFLHLNIAGGHQKRYRQNEVYFMRNQTIFALRSGRLASLVMIASFAAYLLARGIQIPTLVRGVAQGLATVLQG